MKKTHPFFTELLQHSKKIHTLGSILSLLHWDQETHMPVGGAAARSEQVSLLSGLIHEEKTGSKMRSQLEKIMNLKSGKPKVEPLTRKEKVCLREWRKEFLKETKLPKAFVEEMSKLTSEAVQIWAIAKKENNFKLFLPSLQKIVDLKRKKSDILGFTQHPYDALLESYEPCMTTKKVEDIFLPLQKELTRLVQQIQAKKPIEDAFLHKEVSAEKQMELANFFLSKLPVDTSYFRLDLSNHPFSTSIHPQDERITTRLLPHAFMSNIFSLLHEAGHMMYGMGLPVRYLGTPLAEAVSLSIHESQSRWWETLIGKSLPFWQAFYPDLQTLYSPLKKIPLEKFYRAIHKVSPSLIRVEADEVTYCLHVIVRFEIEKLLIAGELPVTDVPHFWNSKMQELLGATPTTDTQGCLQDIHWALGAFGYFPTYALGNLFAAQFFQSFASQHKNWEERIANGDLTFLRKWLETNIHQWGKTYDANQLAKRITKKNLSADSYCAYLKKKYGKIYRL